MMKRLLDLIADIRLTFWLLMAIAALMFAGSLYTGADLPFFRGMNGPRIQDWYFSEGIARFPRTWWIPLLFVVFALLWINLAACAAKRISFLWPKKKTLPRGDFLLLLVPSYVHIVFLVILAAHFMTFTLSRQLTVPVAEGSAVNLPDGMDLYVKGIRHEYFPADSRLKDTIRQSYVMFDHVHGGKPETAIVAFMEPVYAGGNWIMLDMKKGDGKEPQMCLVVTRDPGLIVLVICFIQIIMAMGWYYYRMNDRES